MSFASLGLSAPLLKAVAEQQYTTPSPIQQQAIPAVLSGRDVMAAAQTGTGKTAGFTLPILEQLSRGAPVKGNKVRALILTPHARAGSPGCRKRGGIRQAPEA